MSLPVPLCVRLQTTRRDVHVTREVADLLFRSTIYGFAFCQVSLHRPLRLQADEIALFDTLTVYDGRSAEVAWQGRMEDPGKGNGSNGEVWTVTAVGPMAFLRDRRRPRIYVDTSWQRWIETDVTATPDATWQLGIDGSSNPVVTMSFTEGISLVTDSRVALRYPVLDDIGQKLARVDYTTDAGVSDANYKLELVIRGPAAGSTPRSESFNTAGTGSAAKVITTDWTSGQDVCEVRIRRSGGAATGTATTWGQFFGPVVMATRYGLDGVEITTGASYNANTVLASDVAKDIFGRLSDVLDSANATVATTSYAIDQLAYPSAVFDADILDDLAVFEPDYHAAVWEKNPATGKWRCEYVAWPTTVRYEATTVDGYSAPGSGADLWNEVTVEYVNAAGQRKYVTRTQTVTELDDAGFDRTDWISAGSGIGSAANAAQLGDAQLAEHASPPNAGTLTINRPIRDLVAGRTIMPWEIRPGNLIRVRDIDPSPDALNATDRNGVTVFRVIAVTYTPENGAVLELDSQPRGIAAIVTEARRAARVAARV